MIAQLHVDVHRSGIHVLPDEIAEFGAFGRGEVADDDQSVLFRELGVFLCRKSGEAVETRFFDVNDLSFERPWLLNGWVIPQRPEIGNVAKDRRACFFTYTGRV
ncbi:MAG: hypothetical protein ABSG59_06255 [Verrucomicrobiota bacterium]